MTILAKIVEDRALHPKRLAEKTGLSYQSVLSHISGKTNMGFEAAYKYAKFLNVTVEELLIDQLKGPGNDEG